MMLLYFIGLVLMEWLLLAAEITDQFQYYVWGFLVMVAFSEAINTRNPKLYPNRWLRILYFSMFFFTLLFFNKSILYVQEHGIPIPEPPPPTPGA